MTPVVLGVVVAVLAAGMVLVVSGAAAGLGASAALRDLVGSARSGLRRPTALVADLRGDVDPGDEGGVADVFAAGVPDERGYVDPDELTAALSRVRSVVPRR